MKEILQWIQGVKVAELVEKGMTVTHVRLIDVNNRTTCTVDQYGKVAWEDDK